VAFPVQGIYVIEADDHNTGIYQAKNLVPLAPGSNRHMAKLPARKACVETPMIDPGQCNVKISGKITADSNDLTIGELEKLESMHLQERAPYPKRHTLTHAAGASQNMMHLGLIYR
jgi:hypothetical protein